MLDKWWTIVGDCVSEWRILKWISQLPFACLENVHVNELQVIVVYVVIIWIGIILNGKKDDYNA